MSFNRYTLLFAGAALTLFACKPKADSFTPSAGNADFTKYVSIGNSITSGFADAALYYDGQMVSYPNLIATQLKMVGGGDFIQPLVPQNSVGVGSSINARLVLGMSTDCLGNTSLGPVPLASSGDLSIFTTSVAANGPFNNVGIPGAKMITAIAPGYGNPGNGFGNYNPFFTRILTPAEFSTASMLAKAQAQNATFFSLFLGNNDVLGYALSGGTSDAITPSAGPAGVGFDASVDTIIAHMTANGAKGIIGSVPDITSIPHFTTIAYNSLVLNSTQAAQLTTAYTGTGITFSAGANAFVIEDATAPAGFRKMTSSEYVLLATPQDSLKCGGWGATTPIPDAYILDATEVTAIRNAVAAYNNKLRMTADAKGLAFVDVNAFMANAKTGIMYNGILSTTSFVSGGAFSLDGIHLTPRGNALLANEFIKAINQTYSASIPQVNVAKYPGVTFP